LTVQDFTRILRTRWKIICSTVAILMALAFAYSFTVTPQYETSARLYVTFALDGDGTQTNNGDLYAQRQVLSFIELLVGDVLAQRTVDKLNLDMTAAALQEKVQASSPTGTVVIDVAVTDSEPARARDIANALAEEFVIMAAEISTPSGGNTPNTQVLLQQRAEIPGDPVYPKTKRYLAIAAALGMLLAAVLAIIRDRLDGTIKSVEVIEKATGCGLVADIPFESKCRKNPVVSLGNDRSRVAAAFREMRFNIQLLEVGESPRILLVTSSLPVEGRTTTAINLSLVLAEAGHSVVVVDGDLRHPHVASYLGLAGDVGLSAVLGGERHLDEALQVTTFSRLTALTAGALPPNPLSALKSPVTGDVLSELGRRFDYVVVDSPPLLVADAAILAASCQGVLMIARFGRTPRDQLERAVGALAKTEAPLIGAVLAMAPRKKRRNSIVESFYDGASPVPRDSQLQGARRRHGRHESD